MDTCGAKGPAALDRSWRYLVWECNPLVQIFYVTVLSGGYIGFVIAAHPHLPNAYASKYHKVSAFFTVVTAFVLWSKENGRNLPP